MTRQSERPRRRDGIAVGVASGEGLTGWTSGGRVVEDKLIRSFLSENGRPLARRPFLFLF